MEFILTFILATVLFFYLLGFVGRSFLRHWIRRKQEEAAAGGNPFFQSGPSAGSRARRPRPEGEVIVRKGRASEKQVSGQVGEYVAYEEVEVTEVRTERSENPETPES